jgi:phosphate uptake regulator
VYDEELASNIIEYDSMIDSAYKKARNQIFVMASENPVATQELFWTIEIFHSLEHVADHAVEIARRMKQLN